MSSISETFVAGVGVNVRVGVSISVGIKVGVGVSVFVGVSVWVGVFVGISVCVGVFVQSGEMAVWIVAVCGTISSGASRHEIIITITKAKAK